MTEIFNVSATRALLGLAGLMLSVTVGAADQTLYLAQQAQLRSAATDGDVIANVSPGTRVTVIGQVNGQLKVEIDGWSPEGGEKYLFTEMGQRILLAKITDQGLSARDVVGQQEDYYESVWKDVRLTGWVAEQDTTGDIATVWQSASKLFHQRCTRCHALHRPTEFKANQWPSILKIMTVRAGLSDNNKALVTQYLQTHAKDQPAANDVIADDSDATTEENPEIAKITGDAKLAEQGAALFVDDNCTACHGDDAKTPALPVYPKLAGQNADYVFKQLQDFQSGTRSNDQYGVMKDSVAELSDADARAIAYWLSTQTAD